MIKIFIVILFFSNYAFANKMIGYSESETYTSLPYDNKIKVCYNDNCHKLMITEKVRKLIQRGYKNINIDVIFDKQYLVITSDSEINKCSILFSINNDVINEKSVTINDNHICNYKVIDDYIISSYRDGGKWHEDTYIVNNNWELFFRDECIGCDIIKRTTYSKGKVKSTALLTGNDNFSERKKISGVISVNKVILLKSANSNDKLKAYLINGDVFDLIDMSDDGNFYKIKYLMKNGKELIAWIHSDEFSINS